MASLQEASVSARVLSAIRCWTYTTAVCHSEEFVATVRYIWPRHFFYCASAATLCSAKLRRLMGRLCILIDHR
jgi:hypothetical protein